MPRVLCLAAIWAALAGAAPPPSGDVAAPHVLCLNVGRGQVEGRLVSLGPSGIELLREDGTARFPLEAFREVVFDAAPRPALPPPWTVWVRGGGRLAARRVEQSDGADAADLVGYGWRASRVPLGELRALASRDVLLGSAEAGQQFHDALDGPLPARDQVMVAREGRLRLLPCIVEGMGTEGLDVVAGDVRGRLSWSQVRWVVLSAAQGEGPADAHVVELADGTVFGAESLRVGEGRLTASRGPTTYTVDAPRLRRIRLRTNAYRYLSDLAPDQVATAPLLDVVWPPRLDRTVTGGPIALDGAQYAKGLGVDARTEMTFALDGAYETLHATIGVDDAAGGRGHVIFKVLADGAPAYESAALSGEDDAQSIEVDVSGARRVTLVADFASPTAAEANFADWADARVVR